MKVSIRRSGLVVSAIALALAVPSLSAGDAWAAHGNASVTGGDGGATGSATRGDGTAGTPGNTVVDGANVTVTADELADAVTLTVKGGTGVTGSGDKAGGNASWSGKFIGSSANAKGVGAIVINAGAGTQAGTLTAGAGGSATVTVDGPLYLAKSSTISIGVNAGTATLGTDALAGAGAGTVAGGNTGDVSVVFTGVVGAANDATGDGNVTGFSLYGAPGKMAGAGATGAGNTGKGGSLGTVKVTFEDNATFSGNYVAGAVKGGAGNVGDGGDGGSAIVAFNKDAVFGGNATIRGEAGGAANSSGKGGNATAIEQSYGDLTVSKLRPGDATTESPVFEVLTGSGGSVATTATGSGGNASTINIQAGSATVYGDINVGGPKSGGGYEASKGGTGADANAGGNGGSTSSVTIAVAGDLVVNKVQKSNGTDFTTFKSGNVNVYAADGGNSGTYGNGGTGGAFSLTVGGKTTIAGAAKFNAGTGGSSKAGSSAEATGGAASDITNVYGVDVATTAVALEIAGAYKGGAGTGGAADGKGKGGRGSHFTETYHGLANYGSTLSITGGAGGNSATNSGAEALGGVGGDVNVYYMSDAKAAGDIFIEGSKAGDSVARGKGGDSGTVTVTVDRDLRGDAAFRISAADGGNASSETVAASGNAGQGRDTTLTVGRDLIIDGDHTGRAGKAGMTLLGDTTTGLAGNGGNLTVTVDRVYRSLGEVSYASQRGSFAYPKVAGANGGTADLTVGLFDVAGAGTFAGADAGAANGTHAGGNAGDMNTTVSKYRAAYFGQGLSVTGGDQVDAVGTTPASNGKAGDSTFVARDGYVYSVGTTILLAGGDGSAQANAKAGSASITAKSLTLTAGTATPVTGQIRGTKFDYITTVGQNVHAGNASLDVQYLRTNGSGGYILDIDRHNGSVSVLADNVVARGENLTVKFNERPIRDNKIAQGTYDVAFENLGIDGGATLSLEAANETVPFVWATNGVGRNGQAAGHLYAANAIDATKNVTNVLNVTRAESATSATRVNVQQSAVNRTFRADVANLKYVAADGVIPQILSVNENANEGYGLLVNDTTVVNILGADNLRLGQTVNLVNTAAGSTFKGHNGSGTIGDTWGNVADATYSLGIGKVGDKDYLQANITGFEIRNNWVIDNTRDLTTVATADNSDWRRLSVPGTLSIVDNRYSGPNNVSIVVDDLKGTQGRADLWADRIAVQTTNTVSRIWKENGAQITSTTLDFRNAVAGDLNDRKVHGVAFNTLWLSSGSSTNLFGDMANGAGSGVGTYSFGGRLEVGEWFRDFHTSARLNNQATTAAQALTVNEARFNLSNDLAGRIAHSDGWIAQFPNERWTENGDAAGKASADNGANTTPNRYGNDIVMLEVDSNTGGLITHFDRDWSVDMTQTLDSTDKMETLRKQYVANGNVQPRLTLISDIQGDVSTIRGKTFAEDRTATIEARSWAHQGFIEGVYAVGYGNNTANDKVRDWAADDSVIAEFQGIAADLGKSALQARTASETLLNQGQDLLVDTLGNTLPLGAYNPAKGIQPVAMVAMGGGHRQVDTGSEVSGLGFSLAAGPGIAVDHEYGRTTVGVLFEAGWGDYDLNNAFAWRGAFNAKADSSYYGGAVVVRHDSFCNGIYGEASIRAGYVDSEYKGQQSATNFDTDATYVGGHVGIGALLDTWQDGQADIYAKGLFTHMGSDTVHNTAGEELSFDGSTSVRSRLGGRLSHAFMPTLKGYVGAAWEYEFDGKQQGSARKIGSSNVAHIPAIDTKGHTGIGEIGVQWTAMDNLSVGAGFQGSVGQRDSYGGTARVMYKW